MSITFKLAAAGIAVAAVLAGPAQAQYSNDVIRIGITTDMSSLYSDLDGEGVSKPSAWPSPTWAAA